MPELGELIEILLLTMRWLDCGFARAVVEGYGRFGMKQARQDKEARRSSYLQSGLDVGKCGTSLVKEAVDDAPAKVTVVVIVHLKNLLKCALIDEILDIGELGRGRLGLWREVSESSRQNQGYDGFWRGTLTSFLSAGAMSIDVWGKRQASKESRT
jgi:hypothetical protein